MVDTETSFLYAGAHHREALCFWSHCASGASVSAPLDQVAGVVGGHPFTERPHTRSASLVGSLQLMIAPFPSQAFA